LDLDFKFNNLNFHGLLPADKKAEGRSRVDRDADNLQLQQLEEKDVVSSVANVLSDLCGPGEWMPMRKLHTEVCHGKHTYVLSKFYAEAKLYYITLLPLISANCVV
jgi:hypothetical protein